MLTDLHAIGAPCPRSRIRSHGHNPIFTRYRTGRCCVAQTFPGSWEREPPARLTGHEVIYARTCFIKAVRSCSKTVAQVHERSPITNDSLTCSWPVGRAQLQSCHHALDWLPCVLVMRVSQPLECGSHAHDTVCVTLLTLLVTGMQDVLVTIMASVRNE